MGSIYVCRLSEATPPRKINVWLTILITAFVTVLLTIFVLNLRPSENHIR